MAVRALIGALVAGFIGGAVWAAVSYYTNYEIGWIAWAIGALVGIGAYAGSGGQGGGAVGLIAGVVAVASVLGGKYAVIEIVGNAEIKKVHDEADARLKDMFKDDASFKVHMAHQLVDEANSAGRSLKWPKDMDDDKAETAADFPADVWKDVESRWKSMSADARRDYSEQTRDAAREQIHAVVDAMGRHAKGEGYLASFSPWDILWVGLALVTGARIGNGGASETE